MKGRASGCAAPHNWEEGGAPCFVIFTSHHPIRHSRWEGGEREGRLENNKAEVRGGLAQTHTHTHTSPTKQKANTHT